MSVIKSIVPGTTANIVTRDLKRLNSVEPKLGDQAIKYVLNGSPETVLSTITVKGGSDQLQVGTSYYHHNSEVPMKRPSVFMDAQPYDVALLARYANVLAASCKILPDHIMGNSKTPAGLRLYFEIAMQAACERMNHWPRQTRKKPIKGLTADRLIDVANACGGAKEDLFELLFWGAGPYDSVNMDMYRDLVDVAPLVKEHAEAAFAGVARSNAPGRADFAKFLAKNDLAKAEPFLGYLMAQTGDSAKAVREAALSALKKVPQDAIEATAIDRLGDRKVAIRSAMVTVLLNLGTENAKNALTEHLKIEKTARLIAAIENGLATSLASAEVDQSPDDTSGYTAIDGSRVEIPAYRPLSSGPHYVVSHADAQAFRDIIKKENKETEKWNAENKGRQFFYKQQLMKLGVADKAVDFLNLKAKLPDQLHHVVTHFLGHQCEDHTKTILSKMPQDQALTVAFKSMHSISYWLSPWASDAFAASVQTYLADPNADLRAIENLWREQKFDVDIGGWRKRVTRSAEKGDLLRLMIPEEYAYYGTDPQDVPKDAFWPYIAENLNVLDEAFLGSADSIGLSRIGVVKCLTTLPKVPMRSFGPLLEIATGEKKTGKAEARALLMNVPQVTERLVALLDDSRQAIRAGAAEWIGQRGDKPAIPALKKRLKKEKSELAKAAILTALQQLGEPLDDYVGPAALIREAEAGLKKAKLDKLAWLGLDNLPSVKFQSGKAVPADVLRWWLYLAFKLKQPGGNALFEIFLDQLQPNGAEAFSQWILGSWMAHDTTVPSDEEANAHAEKYADQRYNAWKRYEEDYTREIAFAQLFREVKGNYLNSGAASKGILALASRTPSQVAADRVRAYLRSHGARTSQASALLDMLAGKGDPVSLQVVIAAATRLKQKGVQAYAGTLVQTVADRNNWTMNELGDRVIPTAGLDDDGVLDLPCGPDTKPYKATLSEDLTFVLKNPDGKTVKALPSGTDDTTKASKKQFTASKKELKQVVSMQTGRLYEALCGGRLWPVEDWQRDFRDHPVMRRLTERVVWQGLDRDGNVITAFRPTAEGEYTDVVDDEINPAGFASIRIAHGAMMEGDEASAWEAHLKDYEVSPLFIQFGRSLIRLDPKDADKTEIDDRKGWVLETFQLRGIATKLGYERGAAEDGGWFYEYRKGFTGVGLTAVVSFTGNWLPEENRSAALISLGFEKDAKRMRQMVPLKDVPEVLLSECWNDLHAMAEKASFDPNWEKTTAW